MSLLQEIMSSLQDIAGAVQHFIAATPALQAVADMLLVIIPAALLLAFAGMGFVAHLHGQRQRGCHSTHPCGYTPAQRI